MNENVVAAITRLEQLLRTVDDAFALPRDGARFCHALAAATGARRIVELGTGYGYSTLWLAAAMLETSKSPNVEAPGSQNIERPKGEAEEGDGCSKDRALKDHGPFELITIDHDPRKAETAKEAIARAGLSGFVRFETGHVLEVLERLDGPVDFVLSDADKENCRRYVELLANRIRPRGLIVTDNIETHAVQLSDFLRWIRSRGDFFSTPVMVGNGMELSVKL